MYKKTQKGVGWGFEKRFSHSEILCIAWYRWRLGHVFLHTSRPDFAPAMLISVFHFPNNSLKPLEIASTWWKCAMMSNSCGQTCTIQRKKRCIQEPKTLQDNETQTQALYADHKQKTISSHDRLSITPDITSASFVIECYLVWAKLTGIQSRFGMENWRKVLLIWINIKSNLNDYMLLCFDSALRFRFLINNGAAMNLANALENSLRSDRSITRVYQMLSSMKPQKRLMWNI